MKEKPTRELKKTQNGLKRMFFFSACDIIAGSFSWSICLQG